MLNLFIDLVTYFNLAGFFGSPQLIHANEKWVMSYHPNYFSLNVHEIMLITVEHVECRKTIESLTLINLWSLLLRAFLWNRLRQVCVFTLVSLLADGGGKKFETSRGKTSQFSPQSTRKSPDSFLRDFKLHTNIISVNMCCDSSSSFNQLSELFQVTSWKVWATPAVGKEIGI